MPTFLKIIIGVVDMVLDKNDDGAAFARASSILPWNKYLMTVMGLWPKSPSIFRFGIVALYYSYCLSLIYFSFFLALGNFKKVLRTLSEVITFTQVFYRLITMKRFNYKFGEIFDNMEKELVLNNYRNNKEKKRVLLYNTVCWIFCKVLVICLGITVTLYFLKPLIHQLGSRLARPKANFTFTYELPQRFYSFYEVNSIETYIFTYLFQAPFAIINNFTQASMDCLTLTVTYHLCGQLSVLSLRIQDMKYNCSDETYSVEYNLRQHQRLLGIGATIEKVLESCLLLHLVGASILICILVYNILVNIAEGQTTGLLTFFVYGSLNVGRLYAHCLAGECLIHESLKISDAYYKCNWYNFPMSERKLMILCIKRSQKQLSLWAGKFGTMSLTTFAEVMKTAMAYLSVLRSVI